jgi:hypothetical protein
MMDWLSNFGAGAPAWVEFAISAVAVLLGIWMLLALVALFRDPNNWKLRWKPIVFRSVILAVFCWAFFVAFGPGAPAPPMNSDIGIMEVVDKAPPEKSLEQIEKDSYEKKSEFLKKQDQGFKEEQEEADAYLDKARKRHQNQ